MASAVHEMWMGTFTTRDGSGSSGANAQRLLFAYSYDASYDAFPLSDAYTTASVLTPALRKPRISATRLRNAPQRIQSERARVAFASDWRCVACEELSATATRNSSNRS